MTRPALHIDPDVTRATTPPAALYTDDEIQADLADRVLRRSWQWVGDREQLSVPGSVAPVELLPGCLDEPLVLTREGDRVRLISNVCTHRGAVICFEGGPRRELRCRYHGRRFALDGRFVHMPEFEGAQDFPRPEDDLQGVACEPYGPLLFGSLDPTVAFEDWLGPMRDRMDWMPWDRARFTEEGSADYEVAAHWALYCENFLEGFHIPYVHPGLAKVLDWTAYSIECFAHGSVQLAHAAEGELAFTPPKGSPDHGRRIAAYYVWLFPNLMLNLYPWGLSMNVVEPRGKGTCRVRFRRYVWDETLLEQGAGSGLDQVEMEDEEVVESVQRGIGSGLYTRGRYSPKHEVAVHHFHRLLMGALGG